MCSLRRNLLVGPAVKPSDGTYKDEEFQGHILKDIVQVPCSLDLWSKGRSPLLVAHLQQSLVLFSSISSDHSASTASM